MYLSAFTPSALTGPHDCCNRRANDDVPRNEAPKPRVSRVAAVNALSLFAPKCLKSHKVEEEQPARRSDLAKRRRHTSLVATLHGGP